MDIPSAGASRRSRIGAAPAYDSATRSYGRDHYASRAEAQPRSFSRAPISPSSDDRPAGLPSRRALDRRASTDLGSSPTTAERHDAQRRRDAEARDADVIARALGRASVVESRPLASRRDDDDDDARVNIFGHDHRAHPGHPSASSAPSRVGSSSAERRARLLDRARRVAADRSMPDPAAGSGRSFGDARFFSGATTSTRALAEDRAMARSGSATTEHRSCSPIRVGFGTRRRLLPARGVRFPGFRSTSTRSTRDAASSRAEGGVTRGGREPRAEGEGGEDVRPPARPPRALEPREHVFHRVVRAVPRARASDGAVFPRRREKRRRRKRSRERLGPGARLAPATERLVRAIHAGGDHAGPGGRGAYAPKDFLRAMDRAPRSTSSADGDQHDSQEFLRYLLDRLNDELNVVRVAPPYVEEKDDFTERESDKAERLWAKYKARTSSVVADAFAGQLQSLVTCDACGKASSSYDPFWDLSLPLRRAGEPDAAPPSRAGSLIRYVAGGGSTSEPLDVRDCLEAFAEDERLSGQNAFRCPRCKAVGGATKRLRIKRWRGARPAPEAVQLERAGPAGAEDRPRGGRPGRHRTARRVVRRGARARTRR